jgi:tryptophan 2,3-dioxygenase
MSESPKTHTLTYSNYLKINELLGLQQPLSRMADGKPAHDEMLFILIHQAYELWFRQILHDIESVRQLFAQPSLPESQMGVVVNRLERTRLVLDLLIDQVRVLETMTPLDFLDFRNALGSASGFQSFQFRVLELTLGLPTQQRINYGTITYRDALNPEEQAQLNNLYKQPSLFELIQTWLERTPFVQQDTFNFVSVYRDALNASYDDELARIEQWTHVSDEERAVRRQLIETSRNQTLALLSPDTHAQQVEAGYIRLSWNALVAALLICVYRDQPMLQLPWRVIQLLVDLDDRLATWRFRHAQMVLKMLGKKVGTGGSSGYDYLMKTVESHVVFRDFAVVSTLLVPRDRLPLLPENLRNQLNFAFGQ